MPVVPLVHVRSRLSGQHGYGILLALIAATAIYTVATPDTDSWHLGNVLLQAAILCAAVWSAGARESVRLLVLGVAVIGVLVAVGSLVSDSNSSRDFAVIAALLAALVPLIVTRGLIRTLREEGASQRVIAGALSVYLMIGMLCAYVYGSIAQIGSGPLFAAGQGDGDSSIWVYFSFITQTTVGYGDYTPADPVARAVAITEALAGQLYLVTVISLLVGGFIHQATQRRSAPTKPTED